VDVQVMLEAKINEEYIFPDGTTRVVRTIDVVAAAHEQQRLLRTQNEPTGLSFEDLTIKVNTQASNTIVTTGTSLKNMAMSVPRMFSSSKESGTHTVMQNVSGSVSPGETLLIIGAAGSGCSSLMKVYLRDDRRLSLPSRCGCPGLRS
jgi:ABC-type glutathione transport system ATPase component